MINLKLIHQLAELQKRYDEQTSLPSLGALPQEEPPRREPIPTWIFAEVGATSLVAGRLLALFARQQDDPAGWIRSERAVIDQAIRAGSTNEEAAEIEEMLRQQLDAIFSNATALLPK